MISGRKVNKGEIEERFFLPVKLGNPVFAIRSLLSFKLHPRLKKDILTNLISTILKGELSQNERRELKELIEKNREYFGTAEKILKKLDGARYPEYVLRSHLGRANSLVVADAGMEPFGCIHPVFCIAMSEGKGERRILVNDLSKEISLSVYAACEAIRYCLSQYHLETLGSIALSNYDITVQIGRFDSKYDGGSIGLASAVAIFSAISGLEVPGNLAFTGGLNIQGEIERVKGLIEKLEIAYEKGMKTVYVPQGNSEDLEGCNFEIEIRPVKSLTEVLESVFGIKNIEAFTAWLNGAGPGTSDGIETSFSGEQSALISTVGRRDPYGASYDQEGGSEFTEGPIITGFRAVKPEIVILLPTKDTERNAIETAEQIRKIDKEKKCVVRTLEISDPTDYDKLYIAILAALEGVRELLSGREIFISVSSGTPQMHVVFFYLVQRGKIKAHLIQVKEPRFAKSWQDRVRIIKSEFLKIN